MSETHGRRGYLDWMRGVAVLIMIEAHVIDAWTRAADRSGPGFRRAIILGGFAAPLFLFLAGMAVVLAAESKRRQTGSVAIAAKAVRRRGLEIFGLAFLFRLQAYLLSPGATLAGLLKVDILNVMGPSIVAVALIWEFARTRGTRIVSLALVATGIGMVTPIVREAAWLSPLPDQLEWYFRPVAGRTTFTLFPWSGLLVAGALVGVLLDAARQRRQQHWLMSAFGLAGAVLAVVSYELSFRPSIYAKSGFWTSSPTYFFLRIGMMTLAIPIAWLRSERHVWLKRIPRWSPPRHPSAAAALGTPVEEFGRSSLFTYWIHVEMVYGILSYPLHKQLSLQAALLAWAVFSVFIFALVRLKNHMVGPRERPLASCFPQPIAQT